MWITRGEMNDYEDLLRGVLEDPADDLVRLVFADCIEEGGDGERAEFIRASIENDRNPERNDTLTIQLHLQSILDRRAIEWMPQSWWMGSDSIRGFASSIRLPLADFLSHAKELFGTHPIERVVLTDREALESRPTGRMVQYYWFPLGRSDSGGTYRLPDFLFRLLVEEFKTATEGARGFHSASAADTALSAACVAYGRSLAGLPPMPVAVPASVGGR